MPNKKSLKHIAIIMDGNGRWAKEKGLPRIYGHKEGMKNLIKVVKISIKFKIKYLTVFAFSTENWKRPKKEINFLFNLLKKYIDNEINNLIKNKVKIIFTGSKEFLTEDIIKIIKLAEEKTKEFKNLILNIAFNYGARKEIIDAINFILKNKINFKKNITENFFSSCLYTKNMPDPDILIRTSGEFRLSNFLLWQIAYAELFFIKKHWPDFDEKEYKKILIKYNERKRRFGGI